jgi:hypothetical protein
MPFTGFRNRLSDVNSQDITGYYWSCSTSDYSDPGKSRCMVIGKSSMIDNFNNYR